MSSTQFDPAAIGIAGHLPVESAMPGTTLQLIALNTFEAGGTLFGALSCMRCISANNAILFT